MPLKHCELDKTEIMKYMDDDRVKDINKKDYEEKINRMTVGCLHLEVNYCEGHSGWKKKMAMDRVMRFCYPSGEKQHEWFKLEKYLKNHLNCKSFPDDAQGRVDDILNRSKILSLEERIRTLKDYFENSD